LKGLVFSKSVEKTMKNLDTSDRQNYKLVHVKAAEASKGTQG